MNLNEYINKAKETAIYPDEAATLYLMLGLIGEVGEIANKVKKVIRDHNNEVDENIALSLLSEAGDVMWYAGMLYLEGDASTDNMYNNLYVYDHEAERLISEEYEPYSDLYSITRRLHQSVYKIDECLNSNNIIRLGWLGEELDILLVDLAAFCYTLSSDLKTISELNLKKLSKRKEKNKIKGNGDER